MTPALILTFSPGEKEQTMSISGFVDDCPANPGARYFKPAANDSPSPGGENSPNRSLRLVPSNRSSRRESALTCPLLQMERTHVRCYEVFSLSFLRARHVARVVALDYAAFALI